MLRPFVLRMRAICRCRREARVRSQAIHVRFVMGAKCHWDSFFFFLLSHPVLIMPSVLGAKPSNLTPFIFIGAGRTAY